MKNISKAIGIGCVLLAIVKTALAAPSTGGSPCPEPNPVAKQLFAILEGPSTNKLAEVRAFLKTNTVAVDVLNSQCRYPMQVAVLNHDDDVFEYLYDTYRPDPNAIIAPSKAKGSLYFFALKKGDWRIISYLKDKGGSIEQSCARARVRRCQGYNDLHVAAALNDPDVVQTLIKMGVAVNAKTPNGITPLMISSNLNPNAEVIRLLLLAGAEVNATENEGVTALMAAAMGKRPENVRLLIQAGAQINMISKQGYSALIFAANNDSSGESAQTVIRILIEAGAQLNDADEKGNTPLMHAAGNDNLEAVQALLQAGARVENENKESGTALLLAAKYAKKGEIIQLLVQYGANVNAPSTKGDLPLIVAAHWNKNVAITRALIAAGADVNARWNNNTPLKTARLSGNTEVAKVIAAAGGHE